MVPAAMCVMSVRLIDMYLREHALLLWVVARGDAAFSSQGDCYLLYPSGAFQLYKGVPPDSGRARKFLMQLEGLGLSVFECFVLVGRCPAAPGLFRRLPAVTPRNERGVLDAIQEVWKRDDESEHYFLEKRTDACTHSLNDHLSKRKPPGQDEDAALVTSFENSRKTSFLVA